MMNSDPHIPRKPGPAARPVGDSPQRWIIHCIACETPVEPWQTEGYAFGYCKTCYDVLMDEDTLP